MIQSIERAMAILEILAREGGSARLAVVAERMGIGKTTVHNILKTLDELGYIHRRPGDLRYHLGSRILNLARVAGDDLELKRRLRPALEILARETGETVYLAVPSGDQVYYLDAIESVQTLKSGCPCGSREALEGSAIGTIFLAFIPELFQRVVGRLDPTATASLVEETRTVALRGFAFDVGAFEPGLHCVAVPWKENGEVLASLGLSGPSIRLTRQRMLEVAQRMSDLARRPW